MKTRIFLLAVMVGVIVFVSSARAYPVSTSWNFNMNGVDVESYNCNDDQCSSVSGPFLNTNTGGASSISINYDVPQACGSAPSYTAHYFFKQCQLPEQWYVFSTCDFSVSNNVNFAQKAGCKSDILSLDAPTSVQVGQPVGITASVKSSLTRGVTKPAFIPPARISQFYSSVVTATLTVKNSNGATVFTDTRNLNILMDATRAVAFSWTPSAAGTYTIEVSTDVTDCKCSSVARQSSTKTITVRDAPPVNTPPVIEGIPDKTINVGQTISQIDLYDYASDSQDPDTSLSFSVQSETDTSVIDCYISGNRYVQCGNGLKAGYSDITVQVTDTGGLSDTDTFRITVASVNTPPVIEGIPDKSINVGQTISQIDLYDYASDSQDPDSSLVFGIDSESDPGAIDCYITGNRHLGCQASQRAGYSDITVRVTDTGGLYDTDGFRITVQSTPPVNTPPVIENLPDMSLQVGQTISLLDLYQYAFDSQDPDSELDFSIDSESDPGVIDCYITGNSHLGCGQAQKSGSSEIILRVTDTGGLYDTDGMRITVRAPEEHSPVLNSVGITPSHPKDSDDLVCTAQVSDQDGNLNRVEFRWLVEGGLEKTRTIYVSGSSAEAQDTLGSLSSEKGEQVKCEAGVYDSTGRTDSGYDIVEIEGWDCGVDVYSLEIIENEKIRFRLRNTGAAQEEISWKTYVNGNIVDERSLTLDSGEWELVEKSYDFDHGEYLVKAKATAGCGDTDSETILHQVKEPHEEENPVIDSISITPSDPEESDDLTCRVDVSGSSLDRVGFRWLVEGDLEKTRTVDVSGYDDTAQDTIDSGSFSTGDDVECEATVYDNEGRSDSDSETVTIGGGEEDCGVDVYNLKAIGDEIRFEVRNTGHDEEDISYRIYVGNELVDEHTIALDSGERRTVQQEPFNFGSEDDYFVKVRVSADCGSTDWESVFHQPGGQCEAKYLDDYRCSGLWSQRKYQNSDCTTIWVNSESCSLGCSNGLCIGTGGQCGVSIQKFDYQDNVVAGNSAYVALEARNTGTRQETITLSILVDGQLRDSYPATVSPGSVSMRMFYYYPGAGTHQILVKSETNCGSSDTRTATITVLQAGMQPPYPQPQAQPQPEIPTFVSIYPSSIDTGLCESKFVKIDIHSSREQVFTIQVSGIPSEWVSYQSQNIVKKGDRNLYVYVGPKDSGTRKMKITVKAEGENLIYTQDVSVYTASCPQQPTGAGGEGITGYMIEAAKSPLFWIVLIILAAGIVIFMGARRLEPDEEFYEHVYPYRTYRPVRKSQR